MINKHFMKTLFLFTGMIILGLSVIFLVSYLEEENKNETGVEITSEIPLFAN